MTVKEIIRDYVETGEGIKMYPLSSESMAGQMSRLAKESVSEKQLIDLFRKAGIKPFRDNGKPWNESTGECAWFKMRFKRDETTIGLFDLFDETLTDSEWLKIIIRNAKDNPDSRMRRICRYVNEQRDMINKDITDNDVEDYLQWLATHTPSPKSTLAAMLLSRIEPTQYDRLTPDQQQFVRENPQMQLVENAKAAE